MITVILNCYKRPQYLQEQIEAIKNQTIPPKDIWIWYNKPEDQEQHDLTDLGCKIVTCNYNFKFHGRFAFGLLAQTEYVAFFDDDTIPGSKWFENCLDTTNKGHDGILGTSGVVLTGNDYMSHYKVGWFGEQNDKVKEVDLVGHAWFMKKDYLKYLWYEEPISWDNGEDMQLSFLAQKYGQVKTYVPPHPPSNPEVFGSIPSKGSVYGLDENAHSVSRSSAHISTRNYVASSLMKKGWKLCNKHISS